MSHRFYSKIKSMCDDANAGVAMALVAAIRKVTLVDPLTQVSNGNSLENGDWAFLITVY